MLNFLRLTREEKGVTVNALAKAAAINPSTLWRYETGDSTPPVDTALRLARALDTPVERLFNLSDEE